MTRQAQTTGTWARGIRPAGTWIGLGLWALAGQAIAALTLSPASVTLPAGTYTTVQISGARGQIQAETSDTSVTKVTLSNVTAATATLNVLGVARGSATVRVRDSRTPNVALPVTVTAPVAMTVAPTSLSLTAGAAGSITASNAVGTVSASSANTGVASVSVSSNVVTVRGLAAGSTLVTVRDRRTTVSVPVTILSSGPIAGPARYTLIAWNDLGMHCMDGKDYSVFSILPPFNNLHAQLVNASTGKAVTAGVTLTYAAVSDGSGSVNTYSVPTKPGQTIVKTNFWDYVQRLYGPLATSWGTPPAVYQQANTGLTGNATPSVTPQALVLNASNGWFEATGLPITPYDDAGNKNYYPMVKVTARDAVTGRVLATTVTVLPVSDEITCAACHATPAAGETNPARLAAQPPSGWVTDTTNPENNWKKNILKLHDEKKAGDAAYQAALLRTGLSPGLYYSASVGNKPTLCASCHVSNALPGTGVGGISALTSAVHTKHGAQTDPGTMLTLDSSTNRSACYLCHPGSVTACLRGAMSTVNAIQCQNCHGNMTKVGDPRRVGWLQQPNCQACHYSGQRATSAVDASGNLIVPADTRFATNPDTPALGMPVKFSLYRFSTGHGGLQCEACHGATHAEYPSTHTNDNMQSIALQGYAGTVRECAVCHAAVPVTANGGPHGMHTVGAAWVSRHGDIADSSGAASCAYCHGADYRGSPLAQVKAQRTFTAEGITRTYAPGQNVGCYDCHNGPRP